MLLDILIAGIPIAFYACVLWLAGHGHELVGRRFRRP
jgi:hypothetical protein